MMPAWYLRMNQRERVLAATIAGLLFLIVNLAIWSTLFGMNSRVHADLAKLKGERTAQSVYLKEHALWVQRDQWLAKNQPVLKGPQESSTLLDQVKQTAIAQGITVENPQIGTSDSTPDHRSVFASVETRSAWPPLVRFLHAMQNPETFVVFENINLSVDASDPTVMRGKFKIGRWFAPEKK